MRSPIGQKELAADETLSNAALPCLFHQHISSCGAKTGSRNRPAGTVNSTDEGYPLHCPYSGDFQCRQPTPPSGLDADFTLEISGFLSKDGRIYEGFLLPFITDRY
ncbi:MAG: hypothetical protein KME19_22610 [Microcoleus vaginatus WJT46-NPBG5]|nr:hypothetical protein [Microcoleus vaginatus WJT46-NPBG5]